MTPSRLARLALAVATASAIAGAAAHAYLESAHPASGGVHEGALEVISLQYTMPIETRFSRFDVFRLELPDDALPADAADPTRRDLQRIEALAAALAAAVRDDDGAHEEARLGADRRESGASRTVTLELHEPLAAGVYVVVWEVLATDAHTTRDHHVFLVVDE